MAYPTRQNEFNDGTTPNEAKFEGEFDNLYNSLNGTNTNDLNIKGSITASGSGAVVTAPAGTVSLPAYTFASDGDSGMYRIGADNIGIAAKGANVVDIGTTGVAVTGTLSATGLFSAALVYSGTVAIAGGATPETVLAPTAGAAYLITTSVEDYGGTDYRGSSWVVHYLKSGVATITNLSQVGSAGTVHAVTVDGTNIKIQTGTGTAACTAKWIRLV